MHLTKIGLNYCGKYIWKIEKGVYTKEWLSWLQRIYSESEITHFGVSEGYDLVWMDKWGYRMLLELII